MTGCCRTRLRTLGLRHAHPALTLKGKTEGRGAQTRAVLCPAPRDPVPPLTWQQDTRVMSPTGASAGRSRRPSAGCSAASRVVFAAKNSKGGWNRGSNPRPCTGSSGAWVSALARSLCLGFPITRDQVSRQPFPVLKFLDRHEEQYETVWDQLRNY